MADSPQMNMASPLKGPEARGYDPEVEYDDRVSGRLNPSKGFAVRFPRIRQMTWETANGWLYAPDDKYFPLFITEYVTSFALAGSTAQSQMVRDFYARNFTQPEFRIVGQSPNQQYYNRLGEFIRHFQRKSVTMAKPGRLLVPDSHYVPSGVGGGTNRVSTRGTNKGFLAEGYVEDIERGGERFQFAPDFSFEFTVSNMLEGLYQEDPVTIHRLKSWAEIFASEQHVWEADPDIAAEQQQAAQHAADVTRDLGERQALIHGWHWIQDFLGLNQ